MLDVLEASQPATLSIILLCRYLINQSLEAFLNLHGYTYVRLDGSVRVEARQKMVDRFNLDPKIFCFISSTRCGGIGINLTGADCVIFYDTDWNPAMDKQAQDRSHRIGQTKTVHIYRLI